MILVIGATGQSGAAAVSALVARNMPVRVLMRPHPTDGRAVPPGTELALGDITRPDTLVAALDGVTAVVNCVGVGHDLRTRPATIKAVELTGNRNLIEAAVAAGQAPHVVYLSALMAERAPYARPFAVKRLTEAALAASGLPYTILRPSNFTESIVGDFVTNGVASLAGRFPHPTSPISVHDLGQIAARCATELGPSHRVHDLFGPQTMSFPDVIRRWASARGETVKFRSLPLPAFRVLTAAAAPARPLLPVIYSLIRSFNELDWSGDPAESRRLAGGELLSVDDAARRHAEPFTLGAQPKR